MKDAEKLKEAIKQRLGQTDYIEQDGAGIQSGGTLRIYALGSSSLVWMTWLDQLHLYLKRLGYELPPLSAETSVRYYPKSVPRCDDTKYFAYLKTARFSKIGWSSWDFSFEGWDGCIDGYRNVSGYRLKCEHGPGCHYGKEPLRVSSIARDAGKSNVTLLATWFNDYEQYWSKYACFGGTELKHTDVLQISVTNLVALVRAIHRENPNVWVLVLAKYPQTYRHLTEPWMRGVNAGVRAAVEREPRTYFVDYYMPSDSEATLYQTAHAGHPNCRGSKLMAHAVLRRLFGAKVLAKSYRFLPATVENVVNKDCAALGHDACHTSVMCWVDPADSKCKDYSSGSQKAKTVCAGSICSGPLASS